MNRSWDKVSIKTDGGAIVDGIAPVIISASRATDIPAFHAEWFMNRLERGYIRWENRFDSDKPKYISLLNVRLIVFWTKNPKPMMEYLDKLKDSGLNFYFQFTVNDYENEGFEPAVPPLVQRIETFRKLSSRIGKERVIWRFDPLLLAEDISVNDLLGKVKSVGDRLIEHTDKLVFSFADVSGYPRVKANLIKGSRYFTEENTHFAEFTDAKKHEMAAGLQAMLREWKTVNPDFAIATCAEGIDLSRYGIEHNKCIDDDLMVRVFANDARLMSFIGYTPGLFGEDTRTTAQRKQLKDRNQRTWCGCVYSKDVGCYTTCAHYCTYCYANTSPERVRLNMERAEPGLDSILPSMK